MTHRHHHTNLYLPHTNLIRIIVMLICLYIGVALPSRAITKQDADKEYVSGNYQQAIQDYKELLRHGVSPHIYYNLGNAYYRTDSIAQAILAYERALRMSPGDADIRFNLQLARSKTIDKVTPESRMIVLTWWDALVNFTATDTWAYTAVVSVCLALLLTLAFLFVPSEWVRRTAFYGAAAMLFVFLLANICASQQRVQNTTHTDAIVMSPTVSVTKLPNPSATQVFVLHEGTKVQITETEGQKWVYILLEDGRKGWMPAAAIERI